MRLIGRLFLLFAACALVAWAVWTFALRRPDMQRELYERAASAHYDAARPRPVEAGAFRATACGDGACVLVEAGGLAMLVGAEAGVAEGLHASGLLRANLDGVLLTSLQPSDSAGLADLTLALRAAGRTTPLMVHGPPGVERVVEALNAVIAVGLATPPTEDGQAPAGLLATSGALAVEGQPGTTVFDSGVVAVQRFDKLVEGDAASAVYRIDFDGRSLIAAGCAARGPDLLAAGRGANQAYAVLPSTSAWMLETQASAAAAVGLRRAWPAPVDPQACLAAEDAIKALEEAKLGGALLAPLYPGPRDPATIRLWRELTPEAPEDLTVVAGIPGALLDLRAPGAGQQNSPPNVTNAEPEMQAGP